MLNFTLLFFLLFSSFVCASTLDDWDFATPNKKKCSKNNQIENNFCLAEEYRASDSKLNKVYNKLHSALANPKPLEKSQKTWLKFRDSQCRFIVGEPHEGSEYSYSLDACLIDLTEKRILDIKSIQPCNGCVLFKDEYYSSKSY